MSLPPSGEIPQGAIRFNTDSQRLEFYAQGEWWVMSTDTPNLGRSVDSTPGVRGVYNIGSANTLEYINLESTGNSTDFGDLSDTSYENAACSSSTRGVWRMSYTNPAYTNIIDFITISSTGNSQDFGDGTTSNNPTMGLSNSTRGLFAGGRQPAINTIEYITIPSQGVNAQDFGDMTFTGSYASGAGSPVRGIYHGNRPQNTTIDFVTIATLGNATQFGDRTPASEFPVVVSNPTRALIMGGTTPTALSQIDYVQISTLGDAISFGDLTVARRRGSDGTSSPTRGLMIGGGNPNSNIIDYVNIATQGNAVDFGDASDAQASGSAVSNAHGGL